MVKYVNYGKIYRFDDGKSTRSRYVLVVSNNKRSTDKLVNILFLSTSSFRYDSVEIPFIDPENGQSVSMYVNCGLMTYTPRANLVEAVGTISPTLMRKISKNICKQVNPVDQQYDELTAAKKEAEAYKKVYKTLLDKVIGSKEENDGN